MNKFSIIAGCFIFAGAFFFQATPVEAAFMNNVSAGGAVGQPVTVSGQFGASAMGGTLFYILDCPSTLSNQTCYEGGYAKTTTSVVATANATFSFTIPAQASGTHNLRLGAAVTTDRIYVLMAGPVAFTVGTAASGTGSAAVTSFTSDPPPTGYTSSIPYGTLINFSWTSNNVDTCYFSNNGADLKIQSSGTIRGVAVPKNGSLAYDTSEGGSGLFTLYCSRAAGGWDQKQIYIEVAEPTTTTSAVQQCASTPTLAQKWGGMTYVNWTFNTPDIRSLQSQAVIENVPSNNLFLQLYDGKIDGSDQYFGFQTSAVARLGDPLTGVAMFTRFGSDNLADASVPSGTSVIVPDENNGEGSTYISIRRNLGSPLLTGTYSTRITRDTYDGVGDWFKFYVTRPGGSEQYVGAIRFPRTNASIPASFRDGGGTWTEFPANNGVALLPVPLWHVRTSVSANGTIAPQSAVGSYSSMPNSDIYADSPGGLVNHVIGGCTERVHPAGTLWTPPNLTVSTPAIIAPSSPTTGQSTTLSGTVLNIGGSTAAKTPGFPNTFQVVKADPAASYKVTTSDGQQVGVSLTSLVRVAATPLISSLAPGATSDPVSASYAFDTAGTYVVRLCANINTSWNRDDSVTDAVATDDCGVWTAVTVRASVTAPTACSAPLVQNVTVACDPNPFGVAAISGSVTRSQTKNAYPDCRFPTPVTVFNSVYVSDTCVYPGVINGGWSAWSPALCPTACGQPASTQTRTCTNPTPSGGGADCTGSATSACPATPVCAVDACGTASGDAPVAISPSGTAACANGAYGSSPADTETLWKWSCGTVTTCSAPKYGCITPTDTNYNPTGPSNIYNCALTCKNGQPTYPTCTAPVVQCPSGEAYDASTASCIACAHGGCTGTGGTSVNPLGSLVCKNKSLPVCDPPKVLVNDVCTSPSCPNGATNPPACTICTAPQVLVGGVCTGPAPDLTASATSVMPNPITTGQSGSFSASISNIGTGTALNFPNIFQIMNDTVSTTIAMVSAGTMPALGSSMFAPISGSYKFDEPGNYNVRACANLNTAWGGSVAESNPNNNCGAWQVFTVADPPCPNGTFNPPACTQCQNNFAYINGSCGPCSNGGCTGAPGGTPSYPTGDPSSPTGTLTCNNGASNPPDCSNFRPTVALSANPRIIDSGQSSRLFWSSTNAVSCASTGGFATGDATTNPPGGASTGALTQTKSFQITCTGPGGTSLPAGATVTVLDPQASITANPLRVPAGDSATVTWSASQVESCRVSGPGLAGSGLSGSQSVVINTQATFTITCETNGPPMSRSVTVNVPYNFQEF